MADSPLILCVDDNEGGRYALARTLKRHGFRTIEAATGNSALEQMQQRPDLVILDVQLPDISGYEVCQRIKADPATASTPVLQVSADFVEVEHRTRGLDLGADAYLAHPIEPPELVATVRSLLRARRAEEQARATARQLQTTFDSMSDGVCLVDERGAILRGNQCMEALVGESLGKLEGQQVDALLDFGPAAPFREMQKSGKRAAASLRHGERWLRVTSDPIRDDDGAVSGAVVIFSDFTEQRRTLEERERLLASEQAARAEAQRALQALRTAESRFRRLAESNLFGVLECDLEGRVLDANDAGLAMIGRTRAELTRGELRWDRITPPEWTEADERAVIELREHAVATPYEKEYLRPDGTRVPVYLGIAMIEARTKALAFVLDLSTVKRLDRELRGKVSELEAADRAKDEFLAMLAHELRNPLAAITTGMHLLRADDASSAKAVRAHDAILRQIGVLTRLVDDLLDVSRITRGKVELRKQPTSLQQAVLHALATSRPLVEERRHEVAVTLAPDELFVLADPTRLEQIISNLVNNAAKYTDPGGRISVQLERHGDEALVRVVDSGIGIEPSKLGSVFDLFAQVDQSPARTRGGLGVGLTLVKRLSEMHGGSVKAFSAGLGKGSTFELRLPLCAKAAAAPSGGARDTVGGEHKRLLLIEDNPDIGETLRELLELFGHRVDLASDGLRGVAMALSAQPELALVDIGLPGIDGYEVARRLRADERGRKLRLIALTGYGRPEDRRKALDAGFDAHLVKPVDPEELRVLIAKLSREPR